MVVNNKLTRIMFLVTNITCTKIDKFLWPLDLNTLGTILFIYVILCANYMLLLAYYITIIYYRLVSTKIFVVLYNTSQLTIRCYLTIVGQLRLYLFHNLCHSCLPLNSIMFHSILFLICKSKH